jgi:hypothetical protein
VLEWLTLFLGWLNPIGWIDKLLRGRRESKKLLIYKALEQTGMTPPSLTVEEICASTKLCAKEVESLLYEMIQEGTIAEGPFPGTFTRYLRNFSRSPYA